MLQHKKPQSTRQLDRMEKARVNNHKQRGQSSSFHFRVAVLYDQQAERVAAEKNKQPADHSRGC